MIRLARGAEPLRLREVRERRLAEAWLECKPPNTRPPDGFKFDGYGEKEVRAALYAAQHRKCPFCERPFGEQENPVEHFRPKSYALLRLHADPKRRGDESSRDDDRYWWLAWSWENLSLSCSTCNGSSHKGNLFPVAGEPLPVGERDLRPERALLIDPFRLDPLDHLRWRPLRADLPRDQWDWRPFHLDELGDATIRVFKLDDVDISPQVNEDLHNEFLPDVVRIENLLSGPTPGQALPAWQTLLTKKLRPGACYVGARWSALTFLQAQPGSPLAALPPPPRPGCHDSPPPHLAGGLPDAPPGLNPRVWWETLRDGAPRPDEATLSAARDQLRAFEEAHRLMALGGLLPDAVEARRVALIAEAQEDQALRECLVFLAAFPVDVSIFSGWSLPDAPTTPA